MNDKLHITFYVDVITYPCSNFTADRANLSIYADELDDISIYPKC